MGKHGEIGQTPYMRGAAKTAPWNSLNHGLTQFEQGARTSGPPSGIAPLDWCDVTVIKIARQDDLGPHSGPEGRRRFAPCPRGSMGREYEIRVIEAAMIPDEFFESFGPLFYETPDGTVSLSLDFDPCFPDWKESARVGHDSPQRPARGPGSLGDLRNNEPGRDPGRHPKAVPVPPRQRLAMGRFLRLQNTT